ncbi:MAG: AMP-binding protein [bacterium]|nr:AMP-binding protein [bacterium]
MPAYELRFDPDEVEGHRASGRWPGTLLNEHLARAAAAQPEKPALIDSRSRLTYGELREAVDEAALGLLELGVRGGDVVTVQLPNWNEFVVLRLALERVGAIVNPIAPIFRDREVTGMLQLARPVAAIVAERFRDFDIGDMHRRLQASVPSLRHVLTVGEPGEEDGWRALLDAGRGRSAHREVLDWLAPHPDDVSQLIFTSGTTGEPKGVLHTANTLAAATEATLSGMGLGADDVFHMASTFAHQTGFVYGVHLPLHRGATAVYQDVWDGSTFVELIERHGITYTMGATPFVADTLRAVGADTAPLASLRIFISAGAPIPAPVAEEFARRLGCHLGAGWGMTENGLVTAVFPGDPREKTWTSDGRPHPGMEVDVRDGDGRSLPPGQEGDLVARGAFTFRGYLQGRRFTDPWFDGGGWFHTGDRARLDGDGFVRITGRTKDLIIRGGQNIPVKEIEDLLLGHPALRGVALVGYPDERLQERACACVVLEQGASLDLEDVRAHLRGRGVTPQFWPERVEVVSTFPTTPSGKVQKFRLREAVQHVRGSEAQHEGGRTW